MAAPPPPFTTTSSLRTFLTVVIAISFMTCRPTLGAINPVNCLRAPGFNGDGKEQGVDCGSAMATVSDPGSCCTFFEAMDSQPTSCGDAQRVLLRKGYTYQMKGTDPLYKNGSPGSCEIQVKWRTT